jgi:predicted HD phosphohydrolase
MVVDVVTYSTEARLRTVSYAHMSQMTSDDYELGEEYQRELNSQLPDRLLEALRGLEKYKGPIQVTRLEHTLQSATRAHRDGRDEEYVVAALMHDIGDDFAPHSHGPMVSAILGPFLPERLCWIVEKHPLFQTYYYAEFMGADPAARDKYRDHPYYGDCVEFCELYDQNCFDPEYESLPLEFFEPMVRRIFGRQPRYAAWDVV